MSAKNELISLGLVKRISGTYLAHSTCKIRCPYLNRCNVCKADSADSLLLYVMYANP